jgi:hypothetical protein
MQDRAYSCQSFGDRFFLALDVAELKGRALGLDQKLIAKPNIANV